MSDEESNAGCAGSWKETRLRKKNKNADEGLNAKEREIHRAFTLTFRILIPAVRVKAETVKRVNQKKGGDVRGMFRR